MLQATDFRFASLLGDLSDVPADHIRDVSRLKRFLERWTMDPSFRNAYRADPDATVESLGLSLRPEEVLPLVDDDEARKLAAALVAGEAESYPLSVLRYRAFYRDTRLDPDGISIGGDRGLRVARRARAAARCGDCSEERNSEQSRCVQLRHGVMNCTRSPVKPCAHQTCAERRNMRVAFS